MHVPSGISGETSFRMQQALTEAGLITDRSCLKPLSGGRTNRLWRIDTPQGALVAKLYAETDDNPLFPNDPEAEFRLLRHLGDSGLAPRACARLATALGQVLLYTYIEGAIWRTDPAPVAQALARLHARPLPAGPSLPTAADGSRALDRQTRAILARCPSDLADRIAARSPAGEVAASGLVALLHGDVVPGNIIAGAHGIAFIDWQCPASGDPVHDLATFLSPAMQLAYRGKLLSEGEEYAFLAAYGDAGTAARYRCLAPWFHWRMAAYCAWRVSKGATGDSKGLALELDRLAVCTQARNRNTLK